MKLKVLLSAICALFLPIAHTSLTTSAEELPFVENFTTEAGFNRFTVINANGDTDLYDPTGAGAVSEDCTWKYDASRLCASYTYNKTTTTIAADDWLITPGFELEAGRTYTLVFLVGCANNQGERMEVKLGTSATVAGMTQTILEPTDITDKLNYDTNLGKVYTFDRISVTEAGTYYIGFHAISPANHFRLMLDDIEFSANPFDSAPAAVSNLTVTPGAKGALTATISLTAPTTTHDGGELSSLNRIELKRGAELIHTFNRPEPGETLSYEDNSPLPGNNTSSAVAYNSGGVGEAVELTAYIGIDAPARPLGSWAEDQLTSVVLNWDAVGEVGLNGGYVDPSQVQYIISSMEGGYVVDELVTTAAGATTATIDLDTEAGDQELRQFAIQASNSAGKSGYGVAALVTGQSYRLPFEEHFSNGQLQKYWYRQSMGTYEPAFGVDSSDGDMSCYELDMQAGAQVRFVSGKISLRGAINPTLLFSHLAEPGSAVKLYIEVQRPDGSYDEVAAVDYSKLTGQAGWRQEQVSLRPFRDERYVLVAFHYVSSAANQVVKLDDVQVLDPNQFDLSASLQAPATVKKGTTATVGVTVKNLGAEATDEYRVLLYADGTEVLNQRVTEPLASQASRLFSVDLPVSPTIQTDKISLRAVAQFDYDLDETNNEATATITVKSSGLPTVENLVGEEVEGGIMLTWSQPTTLSRPFTESFEGDEFVPFDNGGITADATEGSLGDWRILDRDGKITFQFSSTPRFDSDGLQNAWFVVQPDQLFDLSTMPRMRAQDGSRYLMAMNAATEGGSGLMSDDWLISPRLSGEEQEVSFWASEYSASFDPEKFELYYGAGPNILNMNYLGQGTITEEKWTEQKFTVPAGARYFAIRHVSENAWGMMVDNFSFRIGAGSIKAYNIYRDGTLLATVDAQDALTYTDQTGDTHTYHVTVVYSDGDESDAVEVSVTPTTISMPVVAAGAKTVYDLQGRRVTGTPTKGVYLMNGRKVVKH